MGGVLPGMGCRRFIGEPLEPEHPYQENKSIDDIVVQIVQIDGEHIGTMLLDMDKEHDKPDDIDNIEEDESADNIKPGNLFIFSCEINDGCENEKGTESKATFGHKHGTILADHESGLNQSVHIQQRKNFLGCGKEENDPWDKGEIAEDKAGEDDVNKEDADEGWIFFAEEIHIDSPGFDAVEPGFSVMMEPEPQG